jgi:hypothetical protein
MKDDPKIPDYVCWYKIEYDLTKVDNQGNLFKTILGSTYMISRVTFVISGVLIQTLFIIAAASFDFLLWAVLKSSMVAKCTYYSSEATLC